MSEETKSYCRQLVYKIEKDFKDNLEYDKSEFLNTLLLKDVICELLYLLGTNK